MQPQHPVWFDWLTVGAIFLGPILALFAQRGLDYLREKHNQRLKLYMTLMSTRALMLAPAHVEALNSIDVVFSRRKDQQIREAWKRVLDHVVTDVNALGWHERFHDLRTDLYRLIGLSVGYSFGTDYLKRQIYAPQYYTDIETDHIQLRKALVKVVTDDGIKIRLMESD